jgi:predicted DsbA family dithiol-disulfide isomerase
VLFHNAPGGSFTRGWLADIAESIGLDRDAFTALLDDPELLADVNADIDRAVGYGINSTPSVAVNGELLTSPSWEELDAAIERAAQGS